MNLQGDIETISRMKDNNVFRGYIEYIRYPKFRNLDVDTKITFDFPVTFLVGKNGGGKSSTLQSLYGCPQGYSLGDYWFTTELDPIKEFEENRNCFIYGYKINGIIKEVLKQRSLREGNPDYWETAKPAKKHQMKGERISPITKNVVYLDFRSELSAYDKFMHFLQFKSKVHKTKQDFLRFYSIKLKEALDRDTIVDYYQKNRNEKKENLEKEELEMISLILGKNFSSIEIIKHNLFKDWGYSIRLKSEELNYSEAFAGSGETAIVLLVHKIYNAEEGSFILLDEPETSLHSGAQKRLIQFILKMAITRKHQFVISTHSPFLIENMPNNSIKVFSTIQSTGRFVINSERHYREAFHELEINNIDKKNIIVEDNFAKIILEKVLENLGPAIKDLFEIKYLPGGADDINQRITTIMEFSPNTFIFFDGDQKLLDEHIDLDLLPYNDQNTLHKLKSLIKKQTNCNIKFYLDGGNKNNEEQEIKLTQAYLKFYKERVFYFPMKIPEDIIWDKTYADRRLKLLFPEKTITDIIIDAKDSKEKLFKLCLEIFGSSAQMESIYLEFITHWLSKNDKNKLTIEKLINQLK